jgi:hypothetical protein
LHLGGTGIALGTLVIGNNFRLGGGINGHMTFFQTLIGKRALPRFDRALHPRKKYSPLGDESGDYTLRHPEYSISCESIWRSVMGRNRCEKTLGVQPPVAGYLA